jgi:hypothetical protein
MNCKTRPALLFVALAGALSTFILASLSPVAADPAAPVSTVAPVAPAQSAPTALPTTLAAPYALKYKFAAGDVHHYAVTMDVDTSLGGNPINLHADAVLTETVQSIQADGSAVIGTGVATNQVLLNGQQLPAQMTASFTPPPATLVMTPTGQVISDSAAVSKARIPGMPTISAVAGMAVLPAQPVNVGDTWSSTFPVSSLNASVTNQLVLKSVSQLTGSNIAEVATTISSTPTPAPPVETPAPATGTTQPATPGSISGQATIDFNADLGVLQETDLALTTDADAPDITNPGAMTRTHSNIKIKMVLQP